MFGYIPPMEILEKSKNVNQLILMNVQNMFDRPLSTKGIYKFLAKILRALLSNKNGIFYF